MADESLQNAAGKTGPISDATSTLAPDSSDHSTVSDGKQITEMASQIPTFSSIPGASLATQSGDRGPTEPPAAPPLSQRPANVAYVQQFSRFSSDTVQRILASAKKESTVPAREPVSSKPLPANPPKLKDNTNLGLLPKSTLAAPMTLHMPIPAPANPKTGFSFSNSTIRITAPAAEIGAAPRPASGGLSAIQKIIQGAASSRSAARKPTQVKLPPADSKSRKTKSVTKPRRGKHQNEENGGNSGSSLSDLSDDEPTPSATATPTVTKSGRQVTRPTAYNPAAVEPGVKKRQRAERSGRPPLCKRCTRWPSFDRNKIVICDDCLTPWHQRCHTPEIADDAVGDDVHWICAACRGDHPAKKLKTQMKEDLNGANGFHHSQLKSLALPTAEEAALADPALVPDLPYNADSDSDVASQDSRGSRTNTWSKGRRHREEPMEYDEYDADPFPRVWPPWPEADQGFYAMLPPEKQDEKHLVDFHDQALNHVVYNKDGKVVWRNGQAVGESKIHGVEKLEDGKKPEKTKA